VAARLTTTLVVNLLSEVLNLAAFFARVVTILQYKLAAIQQLVSHPDHTPSRGHGHRRDAPHTLVVVATNFESNRHSSLVRFEDQSMMAHVFALKIHPLQLSLGRRTVQCDIATHGFPTPLEHGRVKTGQLGNWCGR
jgi:hypothetical protein